MEYKELLRLLRPKNFGTFNVESFVLYRERVSPLLPSWPECPLENWLYRHYDFFIDEYAWLRFDHLVFSMETWTSENIYQNIRTHKLDMVDSLGKQILTNSPSQRSWLQDFFFREWTWPVPIIVLDNRKGKIGDYGEVYGQPYHLLEGHLRLGYFRNLFRNCEKELKDSHFIWVVNIAEN